MSGDLMRAGFALLVDDECLYSPDWLGYQMSVKLDSREPACPPEGVRAQQELCPGPGTFTETPRTAVASARRADGCVFAAGWIIWLISGVPVSGCP